MNLFVPFPLSSFPKFKTETSHPATLGRCRLHASAFRHTSWLLAVLHRGYSRSQVEATHCPPSRLLTVTGRGWSMSSVVLLHGARRPPLRLFVILPIRRRCFFILCMYIVINIQHSFFLSFFGNYTCIDLKQLSIMNLNWNWL